MHELPIKSKIGCLTVGQTRSNNMPEENRWIDGRGGTISHVHLEMSDAI
jgi:hypothetical protein